MDDSWTLNSFSARDWPCNLSVQMEVYSIPDVMLNITIESSILTAFHTSAGTYRELLLEFSNKLKVMVDSGSGNADLESYDNSFSLTIQMKTDDRAFVGFNKTLATLDDGEILKFECANLWTSRENLVVIRKTINDWLFFYR